MIEKIYGVFNSDGSLDMMVKGTLENVYATPLQHIAELQQVDMHDKNLLHYLDENLKVVTIAVEPNKKFDYVAKIWVDPRTIEEVKQQKWEQIKQQREQFEFGGFEFENNLFDSDSNSQLRIATAALLGASVEWTLKDNNVVSLSPDQLNNLKNTLALHISSAHERGRIARLKIEASSTVEEIELVTF
ncbi:DUF4376 domain-containing protein [Acinetobacter pittii]|uniref:DUF4376 domain-containing protein n=1 Tax=Acinetobacter pittii TaxID=48296 RepID=UPI001A151442|nr:DUF4376 domain-containing protein [Acinetobacter pittii]HIN56183.1 DUF4376 domain-containing protein [Acinetobacter pittii]